MKPKISLIACFVIAVVFIWFRLTATLHTEDKSFTVTTWDAFGYYMYLPSIFIYNDYKKLEWVKQIDEQYHLSGGTFYQAGKVEKTGNYVFKYLGGVAILQLPFFLIAHQVAQIYGFPQDGFSTPYQYAVAFGALFYFFFSLLLLRKILLHYFEDNIVTITLLAITLASNLIQYIAVDGAMSHAYIFPLYVLILYFTIRWHDTPKWIWSFLVGLTIGLATIGRPTELIMLFIPLLWGTQDKEASALKWNLVKSNRPHVVVAILGGFLGILPQLLYWKSATGSWIHDVGSKWYFLNPFFRVLFGWEIGWFIYTPITIFFIAGLFFVKKYAFKKSVITFCLLNIYIIISWADWHYGATYSCRAMTQSYPIFALALAAFVQTIFSTKWKWLFLFLVIFLIGVNLFQVKQYDQTILHYRDMNRKYYSAIYLNPNPSPLQMSLLDNDDYISNIEDYSISTLFKNDSSINITTLPNSFTTLVELPLNQLKSDKKDQWMKIDSRIFSKQLPNAFLCTELKYGEQKKWNKVRLHHPLALPNQENLYSFFVKIPSDFQQGSLKLFINSGSSTELDVREIKVEVLKQ